MSMFIRRKRKSMDFHRTKKQNKFTYSSHAHLPKKMSTNRNKKKKFPSSIMRIINAWRIRKRNGIELSSSIRISHVSQNNFFSTHSLPFYGLCVYGVDFCGRKKLFLASKKFGWIKNDLRIFLWNAWENFLC